MDKIANSDMDAFWNGEGAEKWLRLMGRMDKNLLHFGHEAMDAGAVSIDDLVLDIGCGCGDTSFDMGRRVDTGGHVHGIDISDPFIAEARKRKKSIGVTNVTFGSGDAQVFTFEEDIFDVVYSRFGVMFFDDPVKAFKNIRLAMKPGGRLAFICWQPAQDNEWVARSLEVVANHVPLPEPPGPEDPGPMSFGDVNRIRRILTEAGFLDIRITGSDTPFTIGETLDEAVDFLTQLGPAGGAIFQSGADDLSKSRIVSDLHHTLSGFQTNDGIVLGAATWIVTARS